MVETKEKEDLQFPNSEQGEPKLSKNAQKRLIKQEKWLKKQEYIREKRRTKKRKRPVTSFNHLRRFNDLKPDPDTLQNTDQQEQDKDEEALPVKNSLTKKEKSELFKQLRLKGPILIIDCDFEPLMIEKEVKSLSQQLSYSTNVNKQQNVPLNLVYTGVGERVKKVLERNNCKFWHVQILEQSFQSAQIITAQGQEVIEKGRFVYLTADSPNVIKELSTDDVYIIGGIVDRNRYLNLTLDKANKEGIRHGKLPINDHVKLQASTVLAVNHVVDIVATQFNLKDWKGTFQKVIPERKQKQEKEEGQADEEKNKQEEEKNN